MAAAGAKLILTPGGLTEKTQMRLKQAIDSLPLNGKTTPRKFRTGTWIVREWKGKVHEVLITEEGFEYEARSLGACHL